MTVRGTMGNAESLLLSWHEAKLFIEHFLAFSPDALHVIASVFVLLFAGLIVRKPVVSWWPWIIVFLATLLNEFVDLWIEQWPSLAMQYGESAKDVALTMLLPTVLLVSGRKLPRLYGMPASG